MDVLASALLLAAFILFVDLTFGEGNHRAAQLSGLFSSGASFGWPTGVQEEDQPWLVTDQRPRRAPASTTAAAWIPHQVGRSRPTNGRGTEGEWLGARDVIEQTTIEETGEGVCVDRVLAGPTHVSRGRR